MALNQKVKYQEELKKLPALKKVNTVANGIDLAAGDKVANPAAALSGRQQQRDQSFINEYESMPNNNVLQRLFNAEKQEQYDQKQSMVDRYNTLKEQQISDALGEYNNNGDLIPYLNSKGITEKQYDDYNALQKARTAVEGAERYAQDHPALATLSAVPYGLYGGVQTGISEIGNYLTGKPIGSNAALNERAKLASTMTGTVKQGIQDNAKTDAGRVLGGLAYDAAASSVDYLTNLGLTGFNPVAALALMGYKSAANSLNEQKGKNTTADQKMATAAINGAIEVLTEKIPMDDLFKLAKTPTGKQAIKQLLFGVGKQAAEEGVEEFVNEIASNIADFGINGGESDYAQTVSNYMAQGMDEGQARNMARMDVLERAGYAGAAGALSGGVMGGSVALPGMVNNIANIGRNSAIDAARMEQLPVLQQNVEQNVAEEAQANGIPNLGDRFMRLRDENYEIPQQESLADRVMRLRNDNFELNRQNNNTIPAVQTENNVPKKTYDSKNVSGMDEFNKKAKYFSGTYGTPEIKETLYPQFVQTVNEFMDTGDFNAFVQATELAEQLDKAMEGRTYTRKGSKNGKKPGTITTYPSGSMSDLMADFYEDFNNVFLQKNGKTTAVKTQNTAVNTPNSANDLPILQDNSQNQTVKSKNKEPNAEIRLENLKNEVTAEDIGLNEPESIVAEFDVEPPAGQDGQNQAGWSRRYDGNENVSQLATNTYRRSDMFQSDEAQRFLDEEIEKGTYDKKEGVISEATSRSRARENIEQDRQGVMDRLEKAKHIDGVMLDESMMLTEEAIARAEETGNWDEVRRITKMTQEKITDAARALQATAKYTRSAAGALMKTERILQDAGVDETVSDEDMAEVKRLFDEANKAGIDTKKGMEYESKAYSVLAKYLPDTSFMDKWNAWRYLAMLGNTRTHIRNILGNVMFGTVTNVKDTLAGALESATIRDRSNRTKSVLPSNSLVKASKADADNVWRQLTEGGTKWDMESAVKGERRIFKNRLLEGARNFNNNALTAEDNFALVNKYKRALAGYLQSNGKDASIFKSTNQADNALLDRAREYAIKQAQIATFHEDNAIANKLDQHIRDWKNSNNKVAKAIGIAFDAVLPFKKTPANILQQGVWDYNPIQVAKGVRDAIAHSDNPAKAIDEVARGMTGSAILAFGAWLASKGILRAKGDEEDKSLDQLTGEQDFSINVDGKSYTIDWAAPTAIPLFVGAQLYEASQGKFDFWHALSAVGDPIVEMSMLQGLKNMIESIASFDKDKTTFGELAMNIGMGYASQGVPTMLGQITRAVDDTRRSTYTGKKGTSDTVIKGVKKIQNKIPVLSKLNEPYVDAWGQTQENTGGSFAGRLAYNMLSPGYYSNTSKSAVEQELYRLNNEKKAGNVEGNVAIPSLAEKKYDGKQLTPQEYTQYAQTKGQNMERMLDEAINYPGYAKLSDNEKNELLHDIQLFSNALSKNEMFGYNMDEGTYKKKYEAYQQGGVKGLIDYMAIKEKMGGSQSTDALFDALDSQDNLSDQDKLFYFRQNKKSYSKKAQYLDGINEQYAYDWYRIQNEYGTKKDDMIFGIQVSDMPDDEKAKLMEVVGLKDDEVVYRMIVGE